MRPGELTISGFRSYADTVTFDFSGRSLVGIVGPIGSGKSSILDAIAFALYGKTPHIESGTKSLINQRRDALQVSLGFEVDGTGWKVVRALRRAGASAHTLYRVDADGEQEVADKEREVTAQVEAILGLDFAAFRRSVLLAQNQFAQFLNATPSDRGSVLKGVFGFDRLDAMREATKRRLDAVGVSLQVLKERRASADEDRKDLPGKQKLLEEASGRAEVLKRVRAEAAEDDTALRDVRLGLSAATQRLASLDEIAHTIPAREITETVLATMSTADGAVAAADETLAAVTVRMTSAREALASAMEAAGGRSALDAAGELVAQVGTARSVVERERTALAEAEAALAAMVKARDSAGKALEKATAAADKAAAAAAAAGVGELEAREALHAAHTHDRARSLRDALAVGEACPVCDRVVESLPGKATGASPDKSEAAVAKAVSAATEARQTEATARAAAARAEAEAEAAATRLSDGESRLEASRAAVATAEEGTAALIARAAEILGKGDPQERVTALRAEVGAAEDEVRVAGAAEAEARTLLDSARAGREWTRTEFDRLRSDLDKLAGRLDMDLTVGITSEAIAAALKTVREEWLAQRAATAEAQASAEAAVEVAQKARVALLESAGLGPADDLVEVATEADRVVTVLATEVGSIERRLADLDRLDEGEADLVAQAALLERLNADLRPSAFLDFVLSDRRQALADLAGNHLETLTGGRYRFSDDGEFDMLDLSAAEGRRKPDSLSGGETFLASLALALALAEIVGRQGGRLDAFFLDEGFGSLDSEHIDLAMDGIERLITGGTDRLVVLVSHVDAMRDRIEDLIVLTRHPITDHTVVESGATR